MIKKARKANQNVREILDSLRGIDAADCKIRLLRNLMTRVRQWVKVMLRNLQIILQKGRVMMCY